jgi:malonate transporter
VPALLFRDISHQTMGSVFNPDYLAVYALGSFSAMGVVTLLARRARGRSLSLAGLQGWVRPVLTACLLVIPSLCRCLASVASVALAPCMLVENVLVLPEGFTPEIGSDFGAIQNFMQHYPQNS